MLLNNCLIAFIKNTRDGKAGAGIILFFLFLVSFQGMAANKTWSGATGSAWAVAANWVGNSLPGNGDNVLIPGGLINYPVVSANVSIKLITINSTGTGARLTIAAGNFKSSRVTLNSSGLLIVTGGAMAVAGVTVSGTVNVSGGTLGSSGTIEVTGGGVINQTGGNIHLNSNNTLNPNDDLKLNSGSVYNQSDGTLFFKDLLPGGGTFNQTGVRALVRINRHWKMGNGSVFNSVAGTVQFNGNGNQSDFAAGTRQFSNVIISAAANPGFSNIAASTIPISGNFTNNNITLANNLNATFIFNGSANQSVLSATTGTVATLGNLVIDKTGGSVILLSNCNVSGNTDIINGSLDLVTFTSNRSAAGGMFTVAAGGSLFVGGGTGGQTGSNFPLNFSTFTLDPTSNVFYNGAGQTIAPVVYGNLALSGNGGTVIKSTPVVMLVVNGNFTTLTGSATFLTCNLAADISISGNLSVGVNTSLFSGVYTLTLPGNFNNNGSYSSAGLTTVGGTISGSGLFEASLATLELNGVIIQILPAGIFSGNELLNLTVNNPAGILLAGTLNVTGIVSVIQGDFNTGGWLTLVSSATQTALIDGSGSGSVTGNVTMQRYIPSGFGYRYFSSPFQSALVNEFSDDLDLSAAFPVFYHYNENSVATGWVNYSDPAGLLVPLTGYAANLGTLGSAITVDVSGEVNNTPQSVTLSNTNQPFTTGFNLVGNPYPSPIDWDASSGWNRVNIDNAVYYFDASGTDPYGGTYSTYINGISSNGIAGNLVPSMQGFFVHVSDGTYPVAGSLEINNAARTTHLQPVFHRSVQNKDRSLIKIEARFAIQGTVTDGMVIYFDNAATTGFDSESDALKIMNTDAGTPSIYSFSSNLSKLSINALPYSVTLSGKTVIPLGVQTKMDGQVIFDCTLIQRIPDSINVYLFDSEKRINTDLRKTPGYSLLIKKGMYDNRFSLVMTSAELPHITDTDEFGVYSSGGKFFIYINPQPGHTGTLSITNIRGQTLFQKQYNREGFDTIDPGYADGIYMVNFLSGSASFSKKVFLKNE